MTFCLFYFFVSFCFVLFVLDISVVEYKLGTVEGFIVIILTDCFHQQQRFVSLEMYVITRL